MPTIGQFKTTENGFEGHISTLTMARKVSLVKNKNKKGESSPDFFVKSNECDLGFARHAVAQGDEGQPYISVYLDDPSFCIANLGVLFEKDGEANLVWSRSKRDAA